MKRILVLAILSLFIIASCAWMDKKTEKPAPVLAKDGMEAFEKEKYKKAIEEFEQLKDWYPFSKYVILAELKIADAHYKLEEYEDAIFSYEEFEGLHPNNEATPYVIYQIGLCYFEQIDDIDRDQTAARNALDTFYRLIQDYPDNSYSKKADDLMKKCRESLANHEFYVGEFYYKTKHYKSALGRFQKIISDYSDMVDITKKTLEYIKLCEEAIKEI